MNYTDIQPPMTDDEWQAARLKAYRRALAYASGAIIVGVIMLYVTVVAFGPATDESRFVEAFLASPFRYVGAVFAFACGLCALYEGYESWPSLSAPASGRMRLEATELDQEGSEQLFQLAAEVPEVQAIVTAWYAAGRRMNERALRDLQHVKGFNDEAEADAQLQASIAERFSAKGVA